jgi:transposase-like protein
MTARKLSDSEKQTILHLYRTTGETSSSLANQYGVSTSTVSRLLKSSLPADEYEALIQQKRSLRSTDAVEDPSPHEAIAEPLPTAEVEVAIALDTSPETLTEAPEPVRSKPILRRSKRRADSEEEELDNLQVKQLEVPLAGLNGDTTASPESSFAEAEVLKEILSQDLIEPEEDLADDLDDDLDDLDDEDEDDFEEGADQPLLVSSHLREGYAVQILPLADAPIPRTCYLVVDRSAELIAPPLRDFGDLGQIPAEEVQAKTLPIFDNHRIAKRYSNPRTQRVIKLPDGKILSKTASHLRAKGITRLLIDGRVYALN